MFRRSPFPALLFLCFKAHLTTSDPLISYVAKVQKKNGSSPAKVMSKAMTSKLPSVINFYSLDNKHSFVPNTTETVTKVQSRNENLKLPAISISREYKKRLHKIRQTDLNTGL